jgi:uncharacterized protein (DUF1684 family)
MFLTHLLVFFLFVSFGDSDYKSEIKQWHTKREQDLKSEEGWLNLAGLFWLKEGGNTFGSDASNDLVFPKGKCPAFMGKFFLENGQVRMEVLNDIEVKSQEKSIENDIIFSTPTSFVKLQYQSLRWFVIKRGDKYGIRLKDLEHPALQNFTGIKMFPIHEKWKIKARVIPAQTDKKIAITDIIGTISMQPLAGTVVFELQGKQYEIEAIDNGKDLFIIFADPTNKKNTYGAGRFLYVPKPDNEGYTTIDFNKSINPPCAFTEFATCPLPPKQNFLSIAIKAGEKKYGEH